MAVYDEGFALSVGAPRISNLMNFAGAALSLGLMIGVGVWGYQLIMRDVSGIPVVRAATSDMRVRPEDPGGQLAQHQGLAVNEIAARGVASGPVDQVTLAPPAVALAADDMPVIIATQDIVPEATPLAQNDPATSDAVSASELVADFAETVEPRSIDDVVSDVMAEAVPLAEMSGPKVVQAQERPPAEDLSLTPQPAVMTTQPVDTMRNAPGVRASVRPQLRPKNGPAGVVQNAAFTPQTSAEVDAASIPAGTRLAQLGAFASPDIARAEWDRMQTRFGEILNGKSRVVQKAESSGRTFYRLRAMGFVDLNDTRRFCSALLAEGADCIPVQVK